MSLKQNHRVTRCLLLLVLGWLTTDSLAVANTPTLKHIRSLVRREQCPKAIKHARTFLKHNRQRKARSKAYLYLGICYTASAQIHLTRQYFRKALRLHRQAQLPAFASGGAKSLFEKTKREQRHQRPKPPSTRRQRPPKRPTKRVIKRVAKRVVKRVQAPPKRVQAPPKQAQEPPKRMHAPPKRMQVPKKRVILVRTRPRPRPVARTPVARTRVVPRPTPRPVPQQTVLQKHTVSILLGGLTLAAFATGAVATAWYGTVDKPAVDALERAPATYTDAQAAAISQASMTSQGIAVGSWTIGGALFLATMVTFLVESAPPQATKSPNQ